jgi:hypothetical protein
MCYFPSYLSLNTLAVNRLKPILHVCERYCSVWLYVCGIYCDGSCYYLDRQDF